MTNKTPRPKRALIKRIIIAMILLISAGMMIGAVALFFLPNLVSSEWTRQMMQAKASMTLHRMVQIKQIDWTWRGGIIIKGFSIGDDPVFSQDPLLSFDELAIDADIPVMISDLFQKKLPATLLLDGLTARIIRNRDGTTNVESLLAQFVEPKKKEDTPKPEPSKGPLILPVDIIGKIQLSRINIFIKDHSQEKSLSVKNASIDLDLQSLPSENIRLKVSAGIAADGHDIPPFELSFRAADLFDAKTLQPEKANAALDLNLPGASVSLTADLPKAAVQGDGQIDLEKILNLARPFLPRNLADMQAGGQIVFAVTAAGDPEKQKAAFDTLLEIRDLSASGGPLLDNHLQGIGIKLTHKGRADIPNEFIEIETGEIKLLAQSAIKWQGQVKGFAQPVVEFKLKEANLHLGEWIDTFRSYIPDNLTLASDTTAASAPGLQVRNLDIAGALPQGPVAVSLKHLALIVPELTWQDADTAKINGLTLKIDNVNTRITNLFPEHMSVQAGLQLDAVSLSGPQPLTVKNINMPALRIRIDDLKKNELAPFGVTGQISVDESLAIALADIPGRVVIRNMGQSFSGVCRIPLDMTAGIVIKDFKVSASDVDADMADLMQAKGRIHIPFNLGLKTGDLQIHGLTPPDASIKGFEMALHAPRLLDLSVTADADHMGRKGLQTSGDVRFDLAGIPDALMNHIQKGATVGGKIKAAWQITGRMPSDEEISRFTAYENPDLKKDLAFIDHLDVSLTPDGLEAVWPLNPKTGERIVIGDINASAPVRYRFNRKTGKGTLSGKLRCQKIREAPVLGKFKKPLDLALQFTLNHDELKSVRFTQKMTLMPINIQEKLEITLIGSDRLLGKTMQPTPDLILKYLGADAKASVSLFEKSDLSMFFKNQEIRGKIIAGLNVNIRPDQAMGGTIWLKTPESRIRQAGTIDLKGVYADIALKKEYRTSPKKKEDSQKESLKDAPLSWQVMKPVETGNRPAKTGGYNTGASFGLLDASEFQPSVSVASARIETGPMPMEIKHAAADLTLENGLPRLNQFRLDVLGGTITGALRFSRQEIGQETGQKKQMAVNFNLLFSGINAATLFPDAATAASGPENEISGQLALTCPLMTDLQPLLQALVLELDLTHIGATALERFLYALDPSESNETIVSQRKNLRSGTPKWIRIRVQSGHLSLEGEVSVKGVNIRIPSLKRLNIANLTALKPYEAHLRALKPVFNILNILGADMLRVGKDGKIVFKNRTGSTFVP